MRTQPTLVEEDDNLSSESSHTAFCWWRSVEEFKEIAHHKLDLSKLGSISPRLKVLRELERLNFVAAEGFEDLRMKLLNYRTGDFWLPNGGITKEDMNIPPIITILLVGFSGSGKSSLINLMYSVLGRSGLIPFAQTLEKSSNYTTMYLEEHNALRSPRSGFCVYDSRGMDYYGVKESFKMLKGWMGNGVRHEQLCCLDESEAKKGSIRPLSSRYKIRKVNCAMVVVNMAEIYEAFKEGDLKPLDATRELFCSPSIRKCNENPILILTHGDQLTQEERIDGRIIICEFLGASETTGTYDIVCLTEHGVLAGESDLVTAYALTEAIYRALIFSDRTHYPKQHFKDWLIIIISWTMHILSAIFGFLARVFSALGHMER